MTNDSSVLQVYLNTEGHAHADDIAAQCGGVHAYHRPAPAVPGTPYESFFEKPLATESALEVQEEVNHITECLQRMLSGDWQADYTYADKRGRTKRHWEVVSENRTLTTNLYTFD